MSNRSVVGAALAALSAAFGATAPYAHAEITIPTVFVGDAGNAGGPGFGAFGAVSYTYRVGTYEVTAGQYAAFLNAVARTDDNNLYNPSMADIGSAVGCGISRSGSSGSFSYTVHPDFVNRPVNYVSFWDATRFANWMHNGQPTGLQTASTTEDGAYTLTPAGIAANTITRNATWQWAVASNNEWHKAAYYRGGGTNAGYWTYATLSLGAIRTMCRATTPTGVRCRCCLVSHYRSCHRTSRLPSGFSRTRKARTARLTKAVMCQSGLTPCFRPYRRRRALCAAARSSTMLARCARMYWGTTFRRMKRRAPASA
jgi:hypothetical protein